MRFNAAAIAFAAPLIYAWPQPRQWGSGGALYFLDSDPAEASVVSMKIGPNGKLSSPVRTSTGGKGLIGNGASGPDMADPLNSQGSIIVSGNRLFTVNAGSNTLASFYIPESDPQHPILTAEPVSTGGQVPNSVAYSEKNSMVCVTNTGPDAGVQCFSVLGWGEVRPTGNFMPIAVIHQSDPPVGPPNTVSDISFNPSETAILVTVKGDGTDPGYIYIYPIRDGRVVGTPVVSRPSELFLDFAISFITDESVFIVDPAYGASIVHIDDDWRADISHLVNITGQKASCWSYYLPEADCVFVLDAANPNVTAIDAQTGAIRFVSPGYPAGMGSLDSTGAGGFLYTLEASPAITVRSLEGIGQGKVPEAIQYFDLTSVGNRAGFTGLAAWTP